MKIVYIVTKSNFGGAQKYTYELAVAARSYRYDTVVMAGGVGSKNADSGLLAEKLAATNVRFVFISSFMRNISLLSDLFAFIELYKKVKREQPDVLHLSSSKAGGMGALVGRLLNVPRIVFTVHGLPEDEGWRPGWQRFLIAKLTLLTIKLADAVITVNTKEYERVKEMAGESKKVHKIYNGVADLKFVTKEEALRELGLQLPVNTFLIGGIGELHPNKNWSLVVHTLKELPSHVHLCIIGGGQERETILELATRLDVATRVHIVSCPDGAARYLKLFDIFVLPSRKEGLPYVLLEAGLATLPVVATDLPGVHDIIDTGSNGLIIKSNKTELSAAIHMLLRDEGMRERLGENLHASVKEKFSIEKMQQETFATYVS